MATPPSISSPTIAISRAAFARRAKADKILCQDWFSLLFMVASYRLNSWQLLKSLKWPQELR
jgi:hypothetical protein